MYVNETPEGAYAEYSYYNPEGPYPYVFEVQYEQGINVPIENSGSYITGPIPINGDTLTFESERMTGTFNTIVRNGSIVIID